ncbi:MAG: alanine--tRNA ligase [Candidatus Pacebacteria bacterium]|nr:alanine--tRNA ligase [Candidatus Paceibacterota bacterium]MBP9700814.1 alanine--tRNA ligase [Candidatus Paceibacterota bacterium]
MTSAEIRKRFLDFFAARGHAILPSASLVPKNDPSVLFNTAGMQPLVPYLMGEPHPLGNRLASCQKCVRTGDIDDVGDARHLTFFEMLGNWSLGDYFKADAIKWSYEFLTSKEEGLGLDPSRLYVTVFEGDADAPRDMEAVEIWKQYIPENRIYFLPKANNWWSPGDNGPCGPDTEMFYDVTTAGLGDMSHDEYVTADDRGDVVEIWNDVFMEYEKRDGKVIGKLSQKNVDTGSGLERISMIVQGKSNVYEADMFATVFYAIKEKSEKYDERAARIVADHARSAMFLIADGVLPGNKDQGYVLRRLIRRAVMQAKKLGLPAHFLADTVALYGEIYKDAYPEVVSIDIEAVVTQEENKFSKTLESGLKEFEKGADPFILATTYGFPIELTIELAQEKGILIDRQKFDIEMKAHQDASRAGAEQKFKGGLANTNEQTTKLHTAHHLLLKALQEVVSPDIHQKGSNITEERLRIDFNFDRKLTDDEKRAVEDKVNEWINKDLCVVKRDLPKAEAEALGAEMEFGTTYPDVVSVYFIEDVDGNTISKEFCGGPHVTSTKSLGVFKIQKEEASSAGIRRIKATLSYY